MGRPTRPLIVLIVTVLLAACASTPTPAQRWQQTLDLTHERHWLPLVIDAGPFRLQAFVPADTTRQDTLTLYLEGDGFAWINSRVPSADPTPLNPLALHLALAQPEGNAAYLARPCQFLAAQPDCDKRYWTDARFAEEVVESMNTGINHLKARLGARELVLVGYSGGAAIALLLAPRRNDVRQVISIAGNLDHTAWTRYHRVRPLRQSLNPTERRDVLAGIHQVHLVGERDRVTPPELAEHFNDAYPLGTPSRLSMVPGFDHECCWAQEWPRLWHELHADEAP